MVNHRSIAAKIFICFIGVFTVPLAIGAFTHQSLTQISSTERWTQHTYRVLAVSKDLRATILRRDTNARNYLRTRSGDFLQAADAEKAEFERCLSLATALTPRNQSQQVRLKELASLVGREPRQGRRARSGAGEDP